MKAKRLVPLVKVPQDIRSWPVCAADLGFSTKKPTVGLAFKGNHDRAFLEPVTFAEAVAGVQKWLTSLVTNEKTRNAALILEAPLSMSFNQQGNPCCRSVELTSNYQPNHKPSSTKGWFYGAGAILSSASQVFLSRLEIPDNVTIYLAEGFYTKIRDRNEEHADDRAVAVQLRDSLSGLAGQFLAVPSAGSPGGLILPMLGLRALGFGDDDIAGIVLREGLILNQPAPGQPQPNNE